MEYHEYPVPGKFIMVPTKTLKTHKDLAQADGVGVSEPCMAISKDPSLANKYTNKGRTIACISNGTSVLGLGNIGPLASKPAIEGKAALFKRFAGVDCVDLCVDASNPELFTNVVKALAPSFGGVCLEGIKAPECFEIEEKLKGEMPIPILHNDQHCTAVAVLAGLLNALQIVNKDLSEVKIVCNGAGSAGFATMKLLHYAGATRENIFVCDTKGLIYEGREENMNDQKALMANPTTSEFATLE